MTQTQTEVETQSIRKHSKQEHYESYGTLSKNVKNNIKKAAAGEATELTIKYIDEIKDLYENLEKEKVRDTKIHLEDSEVFKDVSGFAALNARNLRFGDHGIALDDKDVFKKLKRFAATDDSILKEEEENDDMEIDQDDEDEENDFIQGEFQFNTVNWLKLGILYYQVSKKPISIEFLNGPLASEKRKLTPRTRTIDDTKKNGSSTTARAVAATDINGDEEKNTAHMVRLVYDTYLKKDPQEEINFYQFFIDPESFAQSVENLFYTSFLVKDGRLKLYTSTITGHPCIKRVSSKELAESKLDSSTLLSSHHVATFDYHVWQNFIEEFNITESFLGHRDEEEDRMPIEDSI
ncbi:uncharacterized protein KGF55_000927 [Candida pseudojiufengensis]|uniref:uncharacterized protein n=1 Tax=Candida pseudojiufengensis TaxID=497109 RepID=UPI002224A879|nr:uncharacterized protein KGF55_000927 [Candida pseudojiufengensis]KAI5965565.1 hypothetical protein KGF55_000927 [Candida pseudojiufengensis]